MLRPDGDVKVLDFGIAKLAEHEVPVTTPTDEGLLNYRNQSGLEQLRTVPPDVAFRAGVRRAGLPEAPISGVSAWSASYTVTGHAPFTRRHTRRSDVFDTGDGATPCSQVTSRRLPLSFSTLSVKRCAKIAERYHRAHEFSRHSKISVTNWKSGLSCNPRCGSFVATLETFFRRSHAHMFVAALALALPFSWHQNQPTSAPSGKSIAVLPFQNLSEKKEKAFRRRCPGRIVNEPFQDRGPESDQPDFGHAIQTA